MTLAGRLTRSLVVLGLLFSAAGCGAAEEPGAQGAAALPDAPDYHSLLVAADDAAHLWLGTHAGLYESRDGGVSWELAGLRGRDVMSLARSKDGTFWAAGHDLLARSADGGRTWTDVRPRGLPGLDVHAFAGDRDVTGLLYAAIAGEGLYRSDDRGKTFRAISTDVGPAVVALAVTLDGVVFAADVERGVAVNTDGDGGEWLRALGRPVTALAASLPVDHDLDGEENRHLLAATGEGVLVTTDKGVTWRETLSLEDGAGPVALAPTDPDVAYAVGLDRTLYRSDDGGESWRAVGSERETASAPTFRGSRPPEGIGAPEFTLRDHAGELVRMRDLRGKAVAVTFLDSQCTESCPVAAGVIARALELLSRDERRNVAAVAITTDPAEDTPRSVRAFLRKTRAEGAVRYLLGSERQLRPVWSAFHVLPSVDTGVDEIHSAPVRIFAPDGVWVSSLHPGVDLTPENLAHDLRAALAAGGH